jgi:hypothetical protein
MAATGQWAERALEEKPSGIAIMPSLWLIHTTLPGTPQNSAELSENSVMVLPNSGAAIGPTFPPSTWAMTWAP